MTLAGLDADLDAGVYGGKAAQLAAAVAAGLPVPPGVALSTELVQAVAAGLPGADDELGRAWSLLRPPLAVRSSAVDEDSGTASFAGQHATYLNVGSRAELARAVRAVWKSARAESALAYRRRLGLTATPQIAVVVQELVEPDCAGVLFTCNPVDGEDELVVEAAWGLGEAVVEGLVTPDRFRIARDGTVLERVAGEKDIAVVIDRDGGTRQIRVPAERARTLCLDERRLSLLVDLAERCERTFEGARDLEWAAVADRIHLLQCRAVTRAPAVSS